MAYPGRPANKLKKKSRQAKDRKILLSKQESAEAIVLAEQLTCRKGLNISNKDTLR